MSSTDENIMSKFRELMGKKKNDTSRYATDGEEKSLDKNIKVEVNIIDRNRDSNYKKGSMDNATNEPRSNAFVGRPSVLHLAKRFEKRPSEEETVIKDKEKERVLTNSSNKEEGNSNENLDLSEESQEDKNKEQIIDDHVRDNFTPVKEERQRTSTGNKVDLMAFRKSMHKEENNNNDNNINNDNNNDEDNYAYITPEKERELGSYPSEKNIRKRSVHDLVQENEKRMMTSKSQGRLGVRNNEEMRYRYTVSENFSQNMSDIKKFITQLKEESNQSNEKEMLKNNEEKLKSLGIHQKDLQSVSELIEFYNLKAINKKHPSMTINKKKQRNTVTGARHKNATMELNVPSIQEEELDEDISKGTGSIRLSHEASVRHSNNKSLSDNKIKTNLKKKRISESVESDESFFSVNSIDNKLELQEALEKNKSESRKPSTNILVEIEDKIINENIYVPGKNNEIEEANFELIVQEVKRDMDDFVVCLNTQFLLLGKLILKEDFKIISNSIFFDSVQKYEAFKDIFYFLVDSFTLDAIYAHNGKYMLHSIVYFSDRNSFSFIAEKAEFKINDLIEESQNAFEFVKQIKKYETESFSREVPSTKLPTKTNLSNSLIGDNYTKTYLEDQENMDLYPQNPLRSKAAKPDKLNISDKSQNNIVIRASLQNNQLTSQVSQIDQFHNERNSTNVKYQKNIINSLDSISIIQYTINSNIPLDPMFFDVLCITCYECVKYTEVDMHSEYCLYQPEENYRDMYMNSEEEEDYNSKLYKLHESLKKKNDEILCTKEEALTKIYEELLILVYEILINNNSLEELDKSITKLNDIVNFRLNNCKSNHKFSLLIIGKRISQLTFTKLTDMEKILIYVKANDELKHNASDDEVLDDLNLDDNEIETNDKPYQYLKMELQDIERQTMKSKMELEQWRKEAKMLENMLRKPNINIEVLSDIMSDVMSRKDESVINLLILVRYDDGNRANF